MKKSRCCGQDSKLGTSVTRFGEISPFWPKFTNLWQCFDGLFLIWQNSKPTWENLLHYWANFHFCKWPNIERQFNHLVTLPGTAVDADG